MIKRIPVHRAPYLPHNVYTNAARAKLLVLMAVSASAAKPEEQEAALQSVLGVIEHELALAEARGERRSTCARCDRSEPVADQAPASPEEFDPRMFGRLPGHRYASLPPGYESPGRNARRT